MFIGHFYDCVEHRDTFNEHEELFNFEKISKKLGKQT